jgi:flagellin
MTVINTNINSLVTQNALVKNNRQLSTAMEMLSTGKRINSAKDDAAGLAISNKMTSQIRGLDQAVRNANDGISMIQTAEGATIEVTNMLQRMRELAVQASNATYSSADKDSLKQEFIELKSEIKRIADNTEWNGMKFIGSTATSLQFQVGANSGQTITVNFKNLVNLTGIAAALTSTVSFTGGGAIGKMSDAISAIDKLRSDFGAKINRLTYAADNLTNVSQNTAASRSRILDTDYAKASSELSRTQIIQQAATAVLAQANQSQQSVLKLLG